MGRRELIILMPQESATISPPGSLEGMFMNSVPEFERVLGQNGITIYPFFSNLTSNARPQSLDFEKMDFRSPAILLRKCP